jgi:transcriptional regulator with XRE-family HTH domain
MAERPAAPLKDLLRERRAELGLTQEQAAKGVGVSTEEYSRWERGTVKTPRVPHRAGIAKFLEIDPGTVNALLDGSDVDETEERLRDLIREVLAAGRRA